MAYEDEDRIEDSTMEPGNVEKQDKSDFYEEVPDENPRYTDDGDLLADE